MGVIDKLKALVSRQQPDKIGQQYQTGTITTGELAESRYNLRWDQQQLVMRAVSETYIAAEFNARQLASVPIRLVKRGNKKARNEKTRVISRERKAWMQDTRVGAKAAQYAHDSDDIMEVVDSDATALLSNPNNPETGVEFMRAHWLLTQTTGCMYWLHNATARVAPSTLDRLYPQWTHINLDTEGVASYSYGRDRAKVQTFPCEQVVPFKWMPSLNNPWYGEGWIKAIAPECDSLVAAIQTSLNRWNNEGLPPFAVSMPLGSGKDQFDQVKEMFRRLSGPQQAGVPYIAGKDMEVTPLQWPNKDIQYLEEKKDLRETIWRAAGIPSQLMQMQSGGLSSGGEGQNAAKAIYAENTLIPALGAFCERLTESYLPLFGLTPGEYWFVPDNPVPEDHKTIGESTRSDTEKAIITINEARAERNLDPIEGGDVLRFAGTPIDLIDKKAAEPAQTTNSSSQSTTASSKEKSGRKTFYTKALLGGKGAIKCACIKHKDAGEVAEVSPYDDVVDDERAFQEAIEDYYRTVNWSKEDGQIDSKKERDRLYAIILIFLVRIYEGGYENGTERLQAALPLANVPPFPATIASDSTAMSWIKEEAQRAAKTIVQTISDELRSTASQAVEAGLSQAEVTQAIAAKMEDLIRVGPSRVAASETVDAFTAGTIESWKASGVVVSKVWHTQEDEKVCPFCDALDGVKKPLGEPFFKLGDTLEVGSYTLVFDYADVIGPKLHIFCRCYLDFEMEG